jgi:hypothetical protein
VKLLAMVLLLAVIPVIFLFSFLSGQFVDAAFGFDRPVLDWGAGWIGAATAGTMALGGLLGGAARLLHRQGRRRELASTRRPVRADVPPVLYLRPFDVDAAMAGLAPGVSLLTAEEQLREAFRAVGPLVAVGRPGEPVPELGAGRVYVGDRWQQVVLDLIMRARLVVLGIGPGEGLRWEVQQVTRLLPPQRLVLLLPADPGAYHESALALAGAFPRGLPAYPAGRQRMRMAVGAAVWFTPDWGPVAVLLGGRGRVQNSGSLETACVCGLRPVFTQLGVRWPGVALPGFCATRRGCLRGCGVVVAVFLLLVVTATVFVLLR